MLAAIISMLELFNYLRPVLKDSPYLEDMVTLIELLNQLKSLGEEALSKLLQRMNYIREILIRDVLPPIDDFKAFLNKVVQIIDCDAKPFIPEGWRVIEHIKGGKLEWNPEKILLYLVDDQKDGKYIEGHKLRKKLRGKPVLNANFLDWLLAHPKFIPEEWKGKRIFFWGTIYCVSDGSFCVRCLYWGGGEWDWCCGWLGGGWGSRYPAAVLASN